MRRINAGGIGQVVLFVCAFLMSVVTVASSDHDVSDYSNAQNINKYSNQRLIITGSSTVAPLASEMAKRFEKQNPGVRIDVQTGGSSRGVADARSGRADIGMASRSLKSTESDLLAHTIALDGITIILHRKNPVVTLTHQQLVGIFTGQITNWKTVGSNDAPITVVNKAEGRSTLELFLQYLSLRNSQVRPSVVIGDNQQGIKVVAGNVNSIGYVSVGAAEFEADYGTPIKLLPIPLSRPLNFVTRLRPEGLAEDFIRFAQSAAVNDLISDQYFVTLAETFNQQASHLQ